MSLLREMSKAQFISAATNLGVTPAEAADTWAHLTDEQLRVSDESIAAALRVIREPGPAVVQAGAHRRRDGDGLTRIFGAMIDKILEGA